MKPLRRAMVVALLASAASLVSYHLTVSRHDEPTAISETKEAEPPPRIYRHADFAGESASPDARHIADWVVDSRDNAGMPFAIVDKAEAKVFVFDPAGHLSGAAAVLLGAARGDGSAPGIGRKAIADITPEERTTPAGRFVAEPGVNLKGEKIVWVDYDAGLSMHAVRAHNAAERRLQRLASRSAEDNRISYGCINVPKDFFRNVVTPAFGESRGIVYVLPETRPANVVFSSYAVPDTSSALALTTQDR